MKVPGPVSPDGYERDRTPLEGDASALPWLPDQPDAKEPEPVLPDRRSALEDVHESVRLENPDETARAFELAEKYNLDPAFTKANLSSVQRHTEKPEGSVFEAIEKNYPGTAKWLNDPRNMAIAKDDIQGLRQVEDVFHDFNMLSFMYRAAREGLNYLDPEGTSVASVADRALESGRRRLTGSIPRMLGAAYDVGAIPGNVTARILGLPEMEAKAPDALFENRFTEHWDKKAAEVAPAELHESFWEEVGKGNYQRASRVMVANLFANAPQQGAIIVAGLLGSPAAGLAFAGASAAGEADTEARKAGVTDPLALGLDAGASGAIEVVGESLGTLGILGVWKKAVAKRFGDVVANRVFENAGATIAKAVFAEGNEEFWTSVGQDVTHYMTGTNPKALEGVWGRASDAFALGMASGGAMTAPGVFAKRYADGEPARRAALTRDSYLKLGEEYAKTKAAARLPRAAQEHLELVAKGSGAETIYIHPEAVDAYFQSKNEDPVAAMQAMGLLSQYTEAKTSGQGTPMAIPTHEWMAKTHGTPLFQGLADDVKLDPKAKTVNEIEQEKAEKEEAKARVEIAAKKAETAPDEDEVFSESVKKVEEAATQKLIAAGYPAREAKLMAKLETDYMRVAADLNDVDPWEHYQKNAPQVARVEAAPPADSAAMNQAPERGAKPALEYAREAWNALSTEEKQKRHLLDPVTGTLNSRAFTLLPRPEGASVAHVSVVGIKYANDRIGHDAGDDLYRHVGQALMKASPNVAKVGGDFALYVKDQAELDAVIAKAQSLLPKKMVLSGKTVSGNVFAITGAVGESLDAARDAHTAEKTKAETEGRRPKRGEEPKGLEVYAGRPGTEAPAELAQVSPELQSVFASLPEDQTFTDVHVEPQSGMLTFEAWQRLPAKRFRASIDLDGLKVMNEAHGPASGDALLRAFEDVVTELASAMGLDLDLTHKSGDEYLAQHDDGETLRVFFLEAERQLRYNGFSFTQNGVTHEVESISLGVGIGANDEIAEEQLHRSKQLGADERAAPRILGRVRRSDQGRTGAEADGNPDARQSGLEPGDDAGRVSQADRGSDSRGLEEARPSSRVSFDPEIPETEPSRRGPLFQGADAAPPAPAFYSKLTRTLEEKMGNSATVDQVRGLIKEIKDEERKWSGIDEFLKGKEKVTKAELLLFVRANQLQPKKITKSDRAATQENGFYITKNGERHSIYSREEDAKRDFEYFLQTHPNHKWELHAETFNANDGTSPKFGKYRLPGGVEDSYEEDLYLLPEQPLTEAPEGFSFREAKGPEKNLGNVLLIDDKGKIAGSGDSEQEALNEYVRVQRGALLDVKGRGDVYRSSHWNEPNVLGHTRSDERLIPIENIRESHPELYERAKKLGRTNVRARHYAEFQSDWHQEGRKKGYGTRTPNVEVREIQLKNAITGDPYPFFEVYVDGEKTGFGHADKSRAEQYAEGRRSVQIGTPDAPLKKTWHEFLLKAAIRKAAEEGYDLVTWDVGEVQAERYDLSKQVSEIAYEKLDNGNYKLGVSDPDGESISLPKEEFTASELEGVVGKEIAAKIVAGEGKQYRGRGYKTLEGADLKVGGEGMKGFYDKIIPDFLRKFGKKYGATVREAKVEAQGDEQSWLVRYRNDSGEQTNSFPSKKAAEGWAEGYLKVHGMKLDGIEPVIETATVHSLDITPALRDAALREGFPLFQKDLNDARGFFDPIRNFIGLLRNMNRSTWFHEMGHFWLESMRKDAEALRAKDPATLSEKQRKFLERSDTVLKELGVASFADIQREHHEKWAKLVEAYIMRGEAPTSRLRQAFIAFKTWMVQVYRNFRGLGVEVSPEIAGVMDRLIATEEEIAQAKAELGVTPLFADPLAEGMNEAQAAKYRETMIDAEEAAKEILTARVMADYARAQSAEYREQRKKVRDEVEKSVSTRRVYRALDMLRGSLEDGTPVRLNKALLVQAFGKDILAKLPRPYVYSPTGIIDHDTAAESLGYASGAELIDDLIAATPKDELIESLVDDEMARLFPDLMNDGGMPEAAVSAFHNEKRAELLRLELEHIAHHHLPLLKDAIRRVARRPLSQKAIREQAGRIIETKRGKELRPAIYERAQVRARKNAGAALAKGDFNAMFQAKQDELLQLEFFRAATQAREEIEKAMTAFEKLRGKDADLAKTRDIDLVNAARAILAQVGLSKTGKTAAQYLEQMREYDPEGYRTAVALVESVGVQAADPAELTFGEFIQVRDSVLALWDLSKSSREIEIDGKKMDVEALRLEMISRLGELSEGKETPGMKQAVSDSEKASMRLLGFRAALRRVESWADGIDGEKGPRTFTQKLVRPILDAVTRYRTAKGEQLKKYREILRPIEKEIGKARQIHAPELGYTFQSKAELLGAILHSGNQSNLSKLLRGRKWGAVDEEGNVDTSRWDSFRQRAYREGLVTKADMDAVQAIWDLFEETKPQAQRAHKAMYGHYFDEISAEEISTPFGTYRGGYMPAKTDPSIVEDGAINEEKDAILGGQNSFAYPTTGRGFTKSRVDSYAAPLAMDMRLVPMAIDSHLRFIHIEPQVKAAARIITHPDFRAALRLVDPAAGTDMLVPWLQRTATQRVSTPGSGLAGKGFDWLWRSLRTNSGRQAMFLNVSNALQQLTGPIVAATKVKPRHLRNAVWTYMRSPKETAEDIANRSPWMKTRLENQAFEMLGAIDGILKDDTAMEKLKAFSAKHTYFLQSAFQNVVDIVTWTGAYNQAVESGMTETQAAKEADAAVRLTQGSVNPEDASRYETGTPFERAFTMFFGYFNTIANLQGTEFQKVVRDMGLVEGAGRALYVYTMGFMLPAVLSEAIVRVMSGKGLDEDDDDEYLDDVISLFFGSQFRAATAMVPIAGQAVNALVNTFNSKPYDDRISTSPAISMLESAASAPVSTYKAIFGNGANSRAIRDSLTLVGMLTGLPLGAIARPLGYAADVSEGRARPSGPVDFARGIITGKSGDKK